MTEVNVHRANPRGLGPKLSVAAYLAATAAVTSVAGIPGGPLSPRLPAGAGPRLPFRWVASALGLDGLSPNAQGALAVSVLALALMAFLAVLFHAWRGSLSVQWLLVVGAGLYVLVAVLPPLGSHDVSLYAIQGRIAGVHHANPYVAVPAEFAADPMFPFVDALWHPLPPFYGPAFIQVASGLARLFPEPASLITLFKVVAAASGVAVMFLVAYLARRTMPERTAFAVALFGWNPLVLFIGAGGGHNDLLLLLAVVGALAVLVADEDPKGVVTWREVVATGLLGLAALIKAPGAVPLVLHLTVAVGRRAPGRRIRAVLAHGAVLLVLFAVVAGPFLQGENPTLSLTRPSRFQTFLAPSVLVGNGAALVFRWVGAEGMSGLLSFMVGVSLLLVFVVLMARLVRRSVLAPETISAVGQGEFWGLGLLALVLSSPLLQPWYLVLALPLAWLFGRRLSFAVAAAAALAAVTAAVIPEPTFANAYTGLVRAFIRPVAAPVLLVLAVVLVRYLDHRIRLAAGPRLEGTADTRDLAKRPAVRSV